MLIDREIQVEEHLAEVTVSEFAQRHALTLARYLDTNQPVMLKIRYELIPSRSSLPQKKKRKWKGIADGNILLVSILATSKLKPLTIDGPEIMALCWSVTSSNMSTQLAIDQSTSSMLSINRPGIPVAKRRGRLFGHEPCPGRASGRNIHGSWPESAFKHPKAACSHTWVIMTHLIFIINVWLTRDFCCIQAHATGRMDFVWAAHRLSSLRYKRGQTVCIQRPPCKRRKIVFWQTQLPY